MLAWRIPRWVLPAALGGVLAMTAADAVLMRRHPVSVRPRTIPEKIGLRADAEARLLEILSNVQNPSATLNALPDAICTPELHMHTAEGENHALLARLQKTAKFTDAREII